MDTPKFRAALDRNIQETWSLTKYRLSARRVKTLNDKQRKHLVDLGNRVLIALEDFNAYVEELK